MIRVNTILVNNDIVVKIKITKNKMGNSVGPFGLL